MGYCRRKNVSVDTVHCLCCEHCLPPDKRTDGRMCPGELTDQEIHEVFMALNTGDNARLLSEFEQQCVEDRQRDDTHCFDGFIGIVEEGMNVVDEKAEKLGRQFAPKLSYAVEKNKERGRWIGSILIGEEYYETNPYKTKGGAISELLRVINSLGRQCEETGDLIKQNIHTK